MENKFFINTILFFVSVFVVGLFGQTLEQNQTGNENKNSNSQESMWDVQLTINLSNGTGAEFDGTYFYVTTGGSNLINKYDTSGNFVETFSISGITSLGDITYDGTYMYGGRGTNYINQMDFTTHTVVSTISVPVTVRYIAYDEINDAFWITNWPDPISLVTRSGVILETIFTNFGFITGLAYDNVSQGGPYLWVFDAGNQGPGPQMICQLNISSGSLTGVSHDVLSDVGIGQPNATAGGLFSTSEFIQNTFSLGGILVGSPTILFAYELVNPTPVELISFTADYYDGKVNLSWTTATEINNKGFEIERATPGQMWERIGFVEGNGTTTNPHTYNFSYEENESGTYQFRLKQIDFEGTFSYSKVIDVKVAAPDEYLLYQNYPNPFNPSTKIKFFIPSVIASGTKQSQLVTLKVYYILGNEITTLVNEEKPAGEYETEFDGTGLPSGIYFYRLRKTMTEKLVHLSRQRK